MQRLGISWQTLQTTPVSVIRASLVDLAEASQRKRMQQLARLSNQTMARMRH